MLLLTETHPRALHVVDIENLLGCARPTLAEVGACYQAYRPLIAHDLVVVACNHGAFSSVAWAWPGARLLVRSGEDGADKALLDVLTSERVEQRFAAVAVASGDGIFAEAIGRLGGLDVSVTVVSRPESLSRRLRMAARHVLELSPLAAALTASGEPA
jgi:hypothetical protein